MVVLTSAVYFRGPVAGWLFEESPATKPDVLTAQPPLTTDRPEDADLAGGPFADVPERATDPLLAATPAKNSADPNKATALVAAAKQAAADNDPLLARAYFSEALTVGLPPADELEVRRRLRQLSRETIFSGKCVKDDPFVGFHVIKPGENLHKIARANDVTAEFLARINNIKDINRIQAGRRIKIVHGPFHARVSKSEHVLDVFLGDTFIDYFNVGLGAEDATPSGKWIVKNKLKNPTYYPPRGGDIVGADDPKNPLGERWMGLDGVEGNATGQMRYGIHGTIEPDSIGKNASMGCIRLHNEDVNTLFDLLITKKSTVTIVE